MDSITGSIHLLLGPMFSEKSTETARCCRRYIRAGKSATVIHHIKNTRSDAQKSKVEDITNHDGNQIYHPDIKVIFVNSLMSFDTLNVNTDVIAIDEGQFFDERASGILSTSTEIEVPNADVSNEWQLVNYCITMSNRGKRVIVAALSSDCHQNPYPVISSLIPHADRIEQLKAVCKRCGKDAIYTRRLKDVGPTFQVGGDELYEANCRRCYDLYTNGQRQSLTSSVNSESEYMYPEDHKPPRYPRNKNPLVDIKKNIFVTEQEKEDTQEELIDFQNLHMSF